MRFRDRMQRFMQGRYGVDNFSRFLMILGLVFIIVFAFTRIKLIDSIGLALLIYCYFRMFSRNIYKRNAENIKYLQVKDKIHGFFCRLFCASGADYSCGSQNNGAVRYKIFKCPQCKQKLRVPKGRGKIEITCRRCGCNFRKRS